MPNEESTLVRVPVFNGQEKNFQSWWLRFQAYARVKGFSPGAERCWTDDLRVGDGGA